MPRIKKTLPIVAIIIRAGFNSSPGIKTNKNKKKKQLKKQRNKKKKKERERIFFSIRPHFFPTQKLKEKSNISPFPRPLYIKMSVIALECDIGGTKCTSIGHSSTKLVIIEPAIGATITSIVLSIVATFGLVMMEAKNIAKP